MSDSKAKSGIGRRKEQTAAVYDQLHQYLRGGIEFLVPADEPSNISIEIASIIAVLDRSNERQNVDDAAGKAVAATPTSAVAGAVTAALPWPGGVRSQCSRYGGSSF